MIKYKNPIIDLLLTRHFNKSLTHKGHISSASKIRHFNTLVQHKSVTLIRHFNTNPSRVEVKDLRWSDLSKWLLCVEVTDFGEGAERK